MENELTKKEFDEINFLKRKIEAKQATVNDFLEYQRLLLKAGFTEDKIMASFYANGVFSFEQYVRERDDDKKSVERSRVINGRLRGVLVGLGMAVALWAANKLIKIIKE
jgi:hypothetical protein